MFKILVGDKTLKIETFFSKIWEKCATTQPLCIILPKVKTHTPFSWHCPSLESIRVSIILKNHHMG